MTYHALPQVTHSALGHINLTIGFLFLPFFLKRFFVPIMTECGHSTHFKADMQSLF